MKKSEGLFNKDEKVILVEKNEESEEINKFLNNLEEYPHAFVLGCLMDVQISYERALVIPYKIYRDLYELKKKGLDYHKNFFNKNKLHRFNDKKAEIFYNAINIIIKYYDDNASKIWKNKPNSF